MGRFETERQEFNMRIAELNEKVKAMHLEHEDSLAQLRQLKELSVLHEIFKATSRVCVCMCVCDTLYSIYFHLHLRIYMQEEAKLSAARSKMDQMMTALKKDFQSTLEKKDAKIGALEEEVRDFQRAADQQHSWVCIYTYK